MSQYDILAPIKKAVKKAVDDSVTQLKNHPNISKWSVKKSMQMPAAFARKSLIPYHARISSDLTI